MRERRVITVESKKNEAPAKKRPNCLRERGEVIAEPYDADSWGGGDMVVGSDGLRRRNAMNNRLQAQGKQSR